ncbi:uncharacterized protein LOC142098687 [Mixophyes fleayi]|uniref:uncharacterized protein LOC142098687 n=1 Tax=Mixophyes fleayi TaxID=3061075 RepID=UPI003F4D92A5
MKDNEEDVKRSSGQENYIISNGKETDIGEVEELMKVMDEEENVLDDKKVDTLPTVIQTDVGEEEEVIKDNEEDGKLSSGQENDTIPNGKETDIGEKELMKANEEEENVLDGQMETTLHIVIENNIKEEEELIKGNEEEEKLFIIREKKASLLENESEVEEEEEIIKGKEKERKARNGHFSRFHKTITRLRRFFRKHSATISPQDNTYDESIADIVESVSKQQSGRMHSLLERLHKMGQDMKLCHRNTEALE